MTNNELAALRQLLRSEAGLTVEELSLSCDRYRLLEKLVKKGYAEKYGVGPRGQNVYRITEAGRQAYEDKKNALTP